jgi:ferredoxin
MRQYASLYDRQNLCRAEHTALARDRTGRITGSCGIVETVEIDLERVPSTPLVEVNAVARSTHSRRDLLHLSQFRRLLVGRWPLLLARAIALAGFLFTILAGLLGSSVGSHNFAIVFVWIAWWTALKLVFIPVGGRSWCSVCPIPMPGEWLQQGGLLGETGVRRGLMQTWPKRLRGYWLQGGAFILIGLFSAVTLTDPRMTAWVLLALFGLATILSLIYKHRAFCSYVCPIGGFTGLYAQAAPVELRVKDVAICKTHSEKTCYRECPWGVYPVALRNNAACGLCMECVRVCPHDNLALNLRPFGADLFEAKSNTHYPSRGLDEAFLLLVMLGSVITFTAVFTGPWGWLKSAAFAIGSSAWLGYASLFLALALVVLPGTYALALRIGIWVEGRKYPLRKALADYSSTLIPLGLFAWIAFTVSFALPKISTVLSVLSDPLGWGWNLFGTAGIPWNLDVSTFSPVLHAALLFAGLWMAGKTALRQGNLRWIVLALMLFSSLFTLAMLWLLVG